MGFQEVIVFAVVVLAGIFIAKKFVRQFNQGGGSEKCSKCELNKALMESFSPPGTRKSRRK